jgi:thiol-disulfide isomerase/thioredoxin
MKGRTHFAAARQIASLAIAVLLAAQACAQDTPPETGLPADSASGREQWVWLPTLAEGLEKAKATSAPILVRCGAEYCPWCRKFDEVIAQPAVQDELEHWVLVAIDVEKAPDDAAKLGVASIPALRIVSNGRMTATHNGYLDADVLVAWLQAHRQESSADASGGPADDSPPDESALGRLVADAAARRLGGPGRGRILYLRLAASPVVGDRTVDRLAGAGRFARSVATGNDRPGGIVGDRRLGGGARTISAAAGRTGVRRQDSRRSAAARPGGRHKRRRER